MRACHPMFSFSFTLVVLLLVVNGVFALPRHSLSIRSLLLGRQAAQTSTNAKTGKYDEILKRMQLPVDNKDVYVSLRVKDEVESFYRNAYHVLGDAIADSQKNLTASTSTINLYSDLTVFDSKPVELPPRTNLWLYTREIASTDNSNHLTLQWTEDMSIAILGTTALPVGFKITFVDGNKTVANIEQNVAISENKYGIIYEIKPGASEVTVTEVGAPSLDQALAKFNYMSDLSSSEQQFAEDDLPRLLQFQLLLAQMWMETDRDLAMGILKYVRATTSASAQAYQLYMQATTLLGRLSILNKKTASYVPNIDMKLTRDILDARLKYAKEFEDSYAAYSKEEVDDANALALAQTLYQNSADVVTQYAFLAGEAEKKMEAAEKALNVAAEKFSNLHNHLASLRAEFEWGLAKWKSEQTLKMVGMIIAGAIELIAEVGFAFVGGEGAAVGGGGGATKSIVGAVEVAEAVKSGEKILSTAGKIAQFLSKIKPTVEAVGRATRIVKITMTELNELHFQEDGEFGTPPKVPKTPTEIQNDLNEQFDIPNLSEDWDEFRNNVMIQYDQLKALNPEMRIEASLEYFEALFNLPDLGQAILAAQTAYMTVSDEYARAKLQQATAQDQTNNLSKYKGQLSASAIKPTFKKAMWDRLVSTRSWVALDFNNYLASYMYFTLDTKAAKSIRVPIMSPSTDYEAQILTMQESINKAIEDLHSQTDLIEIKASENTTTAGALVFPRNWQKQLADGQDLLFNINPNHPKFKGYTRVRMISMRAYLVGSKASTVDLDIKNDGNFLDNTLVGPVAFVSNPTKLGFKYKPSSADPILPSSSEGVLTDGQFTNADQHMQPAPFSDWTLTLRSDAASTMNGVTDIALELKCEVTRPEDN